MHVLTHLILTTLRWVLQVRKLRSVEVKSLIQGHIADEPGFEPSSQAPENMLLTTELYSLSSYWKAENWLANWEAISIHCIESQHPLENDAVELGWQTFSVKGQVARTLALPAIWLLSRVFQSVFCSTKVHRQCGDQCVCGGASVRFRMVSETAFMLLMKGHLLISLGRRSRLLRIVEHKKEPESPVHPWAS